MLKILILICSLQVGCGGPKPTGHSGSSLAVNPTWEDDIRPLFELRCTLCHNQDSGLQVWTDQENEVDGYTVTVENIDKIIYRVLNLPDGDFNQMPKNNVTDMTPAERALVERWVNNEAPQN